MLTRFKIIHQMKQSLPDDKEELKDLAVRHIAENRILQEGVAAFKKLPSGILERMPPRMKSRIILSLADSLPLVLLLAVSGLRSSSYYYKRSTRGRQDKYAHIRGRIRVISEESSPHVWQSSYLGLRAPGGDDCL